MNVNGHRFKSYERKPGDGKTDGLYECTECGARLWVQEETYNSSHLISYRVNSTVYSSDLGQMSCVEIQVKRIMES